MTPLDAPTSERAVLDACIAAVRSSALLAQVIDLHTLESIARSPAVDQFVRENLGRDIADGERLPLSEHHEPVLSLLRSGQVTAAETVFPAVGPAWSASVTRAFLRSLPRFDPPRYALVVLETDRLPMSLSMDLTDLRRAPIAIRTDDLWVIEHVTSNVGVELGIEADQLLGRPIMAMLHPDSALEFSLAATQVVAEQVCARVRMRVQKGDGSWLSLAATLAPGLGERSLALTGSPTDSMSQAGHGEEAVTELQRTLIRIAGALPALGSTSDELDPAVIRTLVSLPERQREIVDRLRRGERVPTIAAALFLSPNTVRNHLVAVYRRFGVNSQETLIAKLRGTDG